MRHLETQADELRLFLLQEPRGRVSQCVNLVVPATDPRADVGFVIIESDYYVPMSGTNTICTVTALLETGMLPMTEPVTRLTLEAPAGLVPVTAACRDGKCESVTFDNVPAFVFALDCKVEVPGLGTVTLDVAYGGMIYALVDAADARLRCRARPRRRASSRSASASRRRRPSRCRRSIPTIPRSTPSTRPCSWLRSATAADGLRARNAVVVSPGRLDRSPCGTGTSARLAVMHARGEIAVGEKLVHELVLGTEFIGVVRGDDRGRRPAGDPSHDHRQRLDHRVPSIRARSVRSVPDRLPAGRYLARRLIAR